MRQDCRTKTLGILLLHWSTQILHFIRCMQEGPWSDEVKGLCFSPIPSCPSYLLPIVHYGETSPPVNYHVNVRDVDAHAKSNGAYGNSNYTLRLWNFFKNIIQVLGIHSSMIKCNVTWVVCLSLFMKSILPQMSQNVSEQTTTFA